MSENSTEGSNVLPFKRVVKRPTAVKSPSSQLNDLLIVYDQMIVLLRETYDEGLDSFADSLVVSVVHCREMLDEGIDGDSGTKLVRKMSAGLHEIPQILRSLLPGIGPRLGESLERKLGVQFSKF